MKRKVRILRFKDRKTAEAARKALFAAAQSNTGMAIGLEYAYGAIYMTVTFNLADAIKV